MFDVRAPGAKYGAVFFESIIDGVRIYALAVLDRLGMHFHFFRICRSQGESIDHQKTGKPFKLGSTHQNGDGLVVHACIGCRWIEHDDDEDGPVFKPVTPQDIPVGIIISSRCDSAPYFYCEHVSSVLLFKFERRIF